ncbi:unnamed protein product [Zymoseptoria tritici ST99CH_1E4]|uniref:Amino acid permease/ SLC12A domain-containing protein n=1 Tax=Zymoseptoria tritici ST99CH_1E4 TaxID=1276532 RepID=A0A2H1H9W9_ZYMTR|nr:unnamed protein product [Zymoseptoria tritici ST99CH_1E4]
MHRFFIRGGTTGSLVRDEKAGGDGSRSLALDPPGGVPLVISMLTTCQYMGSAFFFGLNCPANATQLVDGSSRSLQSPMTAAIQTAGWKGGIHLINAFIFITCLSAVNNSRVDDAVSGRWQFCFAGGQDGGFLGRTRVFVVQVVDELVKCGEKLSSSRQKLAR